MMTGTSGRASRARGSNSIPLIPGMLTSERMRMSLAASAEPTRSKASFADCANSMAKRDARSSLRNCWRKSSATSGSSSTTRISALMIRSGAWKDDGELRKGARLGRDLEHPAVLLDDDVVADRETEAGAFAGGLGGEERIEHFRLHLGGNACPVVANGDLDAFPEVAGRSDDRRIIGVVRAALLSLHRRVEGVGNQVEQHSCDLLREEIGGAGVRVERFHDRHVEAGLLGPRAVIGEIQRLVDHRVDVDRRPLARALARMQQHVLDDRIGALAVLHHLVEVAADG